LAGHPEQRGDEPPTRVGFHALERLQPERAQELEQAIERSDLGYQIMLGEAFLQRRKLKDDLLAHAAIISATAFAVSLIVSI